ncbi:MAG: class I adenylate-forming enzyme family protein [Acidimicrobiales bacterium]
MPNVEIRPAMHSAASPVGVLFIARVNVVDRLLDHPATAVAIVSGDEAVSYGELGERAARWRGRLDELGVTSGDRVAAILGNEPSFVLIHLAVAGLGAMLVPLNPASPPAELGRELDAVAPKLVVASQGVDLGSLGSDAPFVVTSPEELEEGQPHPIEDVSPDTPAALLFTSGTAGMPKPAILTHGNLDASLRSVDALSLDLRASHQTVLVVIPLFHVFGYNALLNLGLDIGATVVLADYQNPEHLADLVASHEVTLLGGPPTMWHALATSDVGAGSFTTVTLALAGAAKLPPATRLALRESLDLDVDEGYGLTETSAMAASSVEADSPVGSVGVLLPGVEARIVGEDGADVFVGDPGELLLRGPMVSPGYFRLIADAASSSTGADADESAGYSVEPLAVDADGWLETGDLAVVDDVGHLAIVDRLKDLVIVSGFNVFPGEVETVLVADETVAAAAVVGEPNERTGESIVAYVVPAAGATVDVDGLQQRCLAELARYKVPSRFEVRDELPTGATGKLRRHELT